MINDAATINISWSRMHRHQITHRRHWKHHETNISLSLRNPKGSAATHIAKLGRTSNQQAFFDRPAVLQHTLQRRPATLDTADRSTLGFLEQTLRQQLEGRQHLLASLQHRADVTALRPELARLAAAGGAPRAAAAAARARAAMMARGEVRLARLQAPPWGSSRSLSHVDGSLGHAAHGSLMPLIRPGLPGVHLSGPAFLAHARRTAAGQAQHTPRAVGAAAVAGGHQQG
jgi:hypothetical protein